MPGHRVALPHRHPAFLAFNLAAEEEELLTDGECVSVTRVLSEGAELSESDVCTGLLSGSNVSVLTTAWV